MSIEFILFQDCLCALQKKSFGWSLIVNASKFVPQKVCVLFGFPGLPVHEVSAPCWKNSLLLYRLTFCMVSSDAFLLCHKSLVSCLLPWTSTLNKLTAAQKESVSLHQSVNALIWEMRIRIPERALLSEKWDNLHPVLSTLPVPDVILVWILFLWCAWCSTENNKETHKICGLASSSYF